MPRWEEAPVVEAKPIKAKWESAPVVQDAPQTRQDDAGRKEGVGVGQMLRNAGQSITGAAKEVANRATTLAGLTPYGLTLRALGTDKTDGGQSMFDPYFQPSNEAQEVGATAERFLEAAAPAGPIKGAVGVAAQAAKAGGTALLQGESPRAAAVAAGFGALGPGIANAVGEAVPLLREGAARQMARVLGPTTKENKAITERHVPELLERGFKGMTRTGLLNKASHKLAKVGVELEQTLSKVPQNTRVDTKPIIEHLEEAKRAFVVDGVEIDEAAIGRFTELQKTISEFGPDISYQSLRRVRQIFDEQVAAARGFYGKTLAEGTAIDAKRELAGAIRRELAKATPDVARVNKEYSFWANIEKVLDDTVQRTQSQSKPLGEQLIRTAAVGGGLGGVATGAGGEAAALSAALVGLNKLIRTPAWNTTAAVTKHQLAGFIASGRFDEAAALMTRLGAAASGQGPKAPAQRR